MNIYLDTNILYPDPFFKSFLGELLLERAKMKSLKINIPEVVFKEIKHKISDKESKLASNTKANVLELSSMLGEPIESNFLEKVNISKKLNEFYNKNKSSNVFNILPVELSHYQKSLDFAIICKAPFFIDKRSEFRDSLIWNSIISAIELNPKDKHYFITNNFNDFWNREKTDIHPDLKSEAKGLQIFSSLKQVFDDIDLLSESKIQKEFKNWFLSKKITTKTIQKSIKPYLWNHIGTTLHRKIESEHLDNLYPEVEFGYVAPYLEKQDLIVKKIKTKSFRENFVQLEVNCSIDFVGAIHLPNYEKRDFSNIETSSLEAQVCLTLAYDRDELFKPITVTIEQLGFKKEGL